MIIKTGNIVRHAGALEWGSGKVIEVTVAMATIQFSDGKNRKIAASHFGTLHPAEAASYLPPLEGLPAAKIKTVRKQAAKK